ncbi:response regulator [Guyparkeria hydrothermalis]|uniref:Response regulator n=1 Tax=Guyparkeria halophila TaxID=47960 RepID=A0A6I6CU80_9GAMM|nr:MULTISPECIES: response regulator [Guyparkeria]MCL7751103.1 response regulator [Guyparkeria hydrothermalis]QGT77549.1 response regulator [Guyparkeria halophila]TKA89947.1 response regulator [Guyparkeria sp. SB14A]
MEATENHAGLDGLRVMVVDDSKTIRRTADSILSKAGCEVESAIDGFDALARIGAFDPDVVIIDILMPRLDGYQTTALIKNNDRFADTPIILLSSKDSIFDKARGRIVGASDYLTKPFNSDEILAAVERFAEGRPVADEGAMAG